MLVHLNPVTPTHAEDTTAVILEDLSLILKSYISVLVGRHFGEIRIWPEYRTGQAGTWDNPCSGLSDLVWLLQVWLAHVLFPMIPRPGAG